MTPRRCEGDFWKQMYRASASQRAQVAQGFRAQQAQAFKAAASFAVALDAARTQYQKASGGSSQGGSQPRSADAEMSEVPSVAA